MLQTGQIAEIFCNYNCRNHKTNNLAKTSNETQIIFLELWKTLKTMKQHRVKSQRPIKMKDKVDKTENKGVLNPQLNWLSSYIWFKGMSGDVLKIYLECWKNSS